MIPTDAKGGPRMEENMIFEDKTQFLRRGLFDVQNEVGLGRGEEIYHQAFRAWRTSHDIPHTSKQPHPILLGDDVAHVIYPDVVVWDCITIELKSMARRLRDEDRVQIYNYLKKRRDKLGLLVNEFNIHRGRSFMHCLELNWGLAINFGKKTLEINALSRTS